MLYKTINELGNVQNKEMLIPMKTRSKHGHQFCKKRRVQMNTNFHSCHKPYPNRTVCQKHKLTVKL